jgi:hypothetical protein
MKEMKSFHCYCSYLSLARFPEKDFHQSILISLSLSIEILMAEASLGL